MTSVRRAAAAAVALGAAGIGYSLWEAHQFRLRFTEVPVLPAGARPVRVLHLSDVT